MFHGSTTAITVNSDAPQALVLVDGLPRGVTPMSVPLSHDRDHTITVQYGSESRSYLMTRSVGAGWVVLDILGVGLLGVVVDAVTGAWNHFQESQVFASSRMAATPFTMSPPR